MLLTIITIASFCAGVFVGALITGSKDKPLKTPIIEEHELFWTKEKSGM